MLYTQYILYLLHLRASRPVKEVSHSLIVQVVYAFPRKVKRRRMYVRVVFYSWSNLLLLLAKDDKRERSEEEREVEKNQKELREREGRKRKDGIEVRKA